MRLSTHLCLPHADFFFVIPLAAIHLFTTIIVFLLPHNLVNPQVTLFRITSRCLITRSSEFRLGLPVLGHPLRRSLVVLKVRVGAVLCLDYSSQTQTTLMRKTLRPKLGVKNHRQQYHLSVSHRAPGEVVPVQYPSLSQHHHPIVSKNEGACLILQFLHLNLPLYPLYRRSQVHSRWYQRHRLRQQHMVTLQRYRQDHHNRPLNRSGIFNGRLQHQLRNIHLDSSQNLILQAQVQHHSTNKFPTLHRVLFPHYHHPSLGSLQCLPPFPNPRQPRMGNHFLLLLRIIPIIQQEWQVPTM